MSLSGQVALVTGASRGIGAAAARRLAAEGARVVLNHPPDDEMARLASGVATEITSEGGETRVECADVSRPREVQDMVARVASDWGGTDILVANAARLERAAWTEIDAEEWNATVSVNLHGVLICAQATYPAMRARRRGKIVTLASVESELGRPGALHYVASKAGVIGLTRALARAVGKEGICVNCVMPGAIQTELELQRRPDQDALAQELFDKQCLRRRGTPADVAAAIHFLATSESDFITGQVITVDGGWVHY